MRCHRTRYGCDSPAARYSFRHCVLRARASAASCKICKSASSIERLRPTSSHTSFHFSCRSLLRCSPDTRSAHSFVCSKWSVDQHLLGAVKPHADRHINTRCPTYWALGRGTVGNHTATAARCFPLRWWLRRSSQGYWPFTSDSASATRCVTCSPFGMPHS
jgi:hypothetical protein